MATTTNLGITKLNSSDYVSESFKMFFARIISW